MAYENLKSTGIKYLLERLKEFFVQIKDSVRSVNENFPDENGNINVITVPYAQNLQSESAQRSQMTFIQRTTAGTASINSGDAWLMDIKGNNVHVGYVPESLAMTVEAVDPENPITATINRDTFVSYVSQSGTTILVYSTTWNLDPELYGVTINGTPSAGDTITIVYVEEQRGTITVANPQTFVSTGWNLYNNSVGYAKVIKYEYGYMISGTYESLEFSETLTGAHTEIDVTDGYFDIDSDGFVWVTGGDGTNTAIYPTWVDWTDGYLSLFEAYSESVVNLATVMQSYFPYGLLKAGSAVDEINLNIGQAISRVGRMMYSAENLEIAKNSGREYEYDESYIYLAKSSPEINSVTIDGSVTADDHGIEYFTGTNVAVDTEILYGNNLKNKLERDVLTISQQTLDASNQNQARANIKASKAVSVDMGTISSLPVTMTATGVTAKMVCVASSLGTPSAQTGDWTVTTATDSVTLSGNIATGASTTVKLILVEQDEITAVAQNENEQEE